MVIETTLRQQNVFLHRHRRYSKSTSDKHASIIVERCVMVSVAEFGGVLVVSSQIVTRMLTIALY